MIQTICSKLWILKDNLKEDARGVSALEYAILGAIIIGALVAVLNTDAISGVFQNFLNVLEDPNAEP